MKKLILSAVMMLGFAAPVFAAATPVNVVTTQTIFADLVRRVGGEKVTVKAIASPKFNIHFIQPKPSDVRSLSKADLYVNAGLELEAWSGPLIEAAGRPEFFPSGGRALDLSKGLRILGVPDHVVTRAEGDIHPLGNPHYPMNPENARVMAERIAGALKEIDPADGPVYDANLAAFNRKLDEKIAEWKNECAACAGKEIISYHEDIEYFAEFLGLKAEQFIEPKPGIPPTPKHLEFLEEYAKANGVKAIVMPTYYPRDAAESLANKLGAKLVIIYQGVGEGPGTDDLFSFFDVNIKAMTEALK